MISLLAAGNPFVNAYLQSDWFGRGIFWGIFFLSGISWTILLHKSWVFFQVRRLSKEFSDVFSEKDPLNVQWHRPLKGRWLEVPHPL